jgi:hypothetical protein
MSLTLNVSRCMASRAALYCSIHLFRAVNASVSRKQYKGQRESSAR